GAMTLVAFDDLGDQDVAPGPQPRPPTHARAHGIATGLPNGADVGHQAIGADQQRTVRSTAADALDQPPDQGQVALLADLAAQPHAGLLPHCHVPPHKNAPPLYAPPARLPPSPAPPLPRHNT